MHHHADPSPYLHSNVRRFVAPEMQDKRLRPIGQPTGNGVSAHEFSRILRAKIEALLKEGGKLSVIEVADAVGSSKTSARRHLNCLVDTGFAESTPGYVRTCREQLKFWIK